jgi:hypothetical protein
MAKFCPQKGQNPNHMGQFLRNLYSNQIKRKQTNLKTKRATIPFSKKERANT